MNQNAKTKDLMLSGLLLAMGILLPMFFHSVGIMGKVFLPMHIPVLIGGFVLSPYLACILGVITPLISGALTGMPIMFPMAIIMAFELGTYGLMTSLAVRKMRLSVIPSLIIAMISGRVIAGVVVFFLAQFFGLKMNPILFIKGGILTGLPGIGVQLILIPSIIYGLKGIIRKEGIRV
ncbi:ECF transporter S component [Crassaminicella profunda]|uniref:ECF transporter S component n=1 Tax=Crassaminicella profunda TaxID=1286698 RepID=UPI001CA68AB8|nr:ECF transporter S component [Crassaminicella profunda]QZY55209.1 ECF transporter S component [Crassaminicella profunda]